MSFIHSGVEMASSSNSNDLFSAWNLAYSFVPAMALKCALLLKIPDIICKAGPLSIPQIAAHMERPPALDYLSRIVRYLSSVGVFSELTTDGETLYDLTRMTRSYFVSEGNPTSLAAYHLFLNDELSQAAWHCLAESVVEGRNAFHVAHGKDIWYYGSDDARYNRVVNDGMLSATSVQMRDILADYDGFKEVGTLVDVGGGVGRELGEIIAAYPHIHGINFDLPHVVATAPHIAGVEHVGGNMFESVPSGDAFFLKQVLHDWDDHCCIKILRNCFEALPEKGKLILGEGVMEASQRSYQPLQLLDLNMIVLSDGGKERSRQQWIDLLRQGGFRINRIVGREESILKIIEATKVLD